MARRNRGNANPTNPEDQSHKCFTGVIGFSVRDTTDGDHSGFVDAGIVYSELHEDSRQLIEDFVSIYGVEMQAALQPYAKLLAQLGGQFLQGNPKYLAGRAMLDKIVAENPPKDLSQLTRS